MFCQPLTNFGKGKLTCDVNCDGMGDQYWSNRDLHPFLPKHASFLCLARGTLCTSSGRTIRRRGWGKLSTNSLHLNQILCAGCSVTTPLFSLLSFKKSCGDEVKASGTGKGCCWRFLVRASHTGGWWVMAVSVYKRGQMHNSCPPLVAKQTCLG